MRKHNSMPWQTAAGAAAFLWAVSAAAFPKPETSEYGISLRIDGFGQSPPRAADIGAQALRCREVDAAGPVRIPVAVKNGSGRGVSGTLTVSMNADWSVSPAKGFDVKLASGEERQFEFTASGNGNVLTALYPVSARFLADGNRRIDVTAVAKSVSARRAFEPYPAKLHKTANGVSRPTVSAETGERAKALAVAAHKGREDAANGGFLLEEDGVFYGAGYVPGPNGVMDGAFAFTDGRRTIVINGFECWVDGALVKDQKDIPWADVAVTAERGALKVKWSGDRAVRRPDGSPRFTRLAPGAASESISRAYGGFGYVWDKPRHFTLNAGAFGLSTRHAGIDYNNGLSMVMAVDASPDAFEVDGEHGVAGISTHNDATFYFVPSAFGAFDAARRFSSVSGYEASPGHDALVGRMCLDDWSGLYAREAEAIRMAGKYGLNHSVYLQHSAQRWGYDVRLPDIYPPKGNIGEFQSMVLAAKNAGMLFGVHDNYVDFYPDADCFSYGSICFNADGTPQEAWYNPGPRDLSYRWLPSAILPSVRRNMAWARTNFAPTALFLDVFSASYPKDFIDRNGVFHPAAETKRHWCDALAECRRSGGNPRLAIVSESGNDALIGHLDAGISDHYIPEFVVQDRSKYAAAERIPWHDAVSHGKMVLFGGGLGSRYCMKGWSRPGDVKLHGYATDDYFCTTVIGGRSPICGGAFGRDVVKTYWMLHDTCDMLARGRFTDLRFEGGIERQHAVFSTGEVWINRRTNSVWSVKGAELPGYGFIAITRDGYEAGVIRRGGVRIGYSKSPGMWFVDARPPAGDGRLHEVEADAVAWKASSQTSGRISVDWRLRRPISAEFIPFVHIVPENDPRRIAFHASTTPMPEGDIVIRLPKTIAPGKYSVRYGFFSKVGARLPIGGYGDGTGRVRGGTIEVVEHGGKPAIAGWSRERPPVRHDGLETNTERKMVDFGGIRTDGAFRIHFPDLKIVPLPGSEPFRVEIELERFGIAAAGAFRLEDPGSGAVHPAATIERGVLKASFDAKSQAYRFGK